MYFNPSHPIGWSALFDDPVQRTQLQHFHLHKIYVSADSELPTVDVVAAGAGQTGTQFASGDVRYRLYRPCIRFSPAL